MSDQNENLALGSRQARFGWIVVAVFVLLGLFLEGLNGFKIGWYVDVVAETRRHMWTLAHAHGTLVGLVNVVYGVALYSGAAPAGGRAPLCARLFSIAAFLLPAGFFLGGVYVHGGDPGVAIVLVPVGALALLVGVVLVAIESR